MKKILISIFMVLVVLNSVNAVSFSTITMIGNVAGLQLPAELTKGLSQAQCAINFIDCATSQVTGKILGTAFNALPPSMQKAINTYNQVKGYTDQVAGIIGELKVNSDTGSISGGLKTKDQKKNIVVKDISMTYDDKTKTSKYEFTESLSSLSINNQINPKGDIHENVFTNIKKKDANTNANIVVDKDGNVVSADLTANGKGSTFVFNEEKIKVPPNGRVTYENGKITMYAQKGKDLNFELDTLQGTFIAPQQYIISGEGNVAWDGYTLAISKDTKVTDNKLGFSVTNDGNDVLSLANDKEFVHGNNWIVADEYSLEFNAKNAYIKLLPNNSWIRMEENDQLYFSLHDGVGAGIITQKGFRYMGGSVTEGSCSAALFFSEEKVDTTDITQKSCVNIDNFYRDKNYRLYNGGVYIEKCSPVNEENVESTGLVTGMAEAQPKPKGTIIQSNTPPLCNGKEVLVMKAVVDVDDISYHWPINSQFCYSDLKTLYNKILPYKGETINSNCIDQRQWKSIADQCNRFKIGGYISERNKQGLEDCNTILNLTKNNRNEIQSYLENGWIIDQCKGTCPPNKYCSKDKICKDIQTLVEPEATPELARQSDECVVCTDVCNKCVSTNANGVCNGLPARCVTGACNYLCSPCVKICS